MALKYGHLTKEEKLDSSVATLTILKGRLTGQFYRDVEMVIDYLKDVKQEITKGEDNATSNTRKSST